MYSIVAPGQFLRQARKFLQSRPDLKDRFSRVVSDLLKGPLAQHLELYSLQARLDGFYAMRLTYSCRITLTLALLEKEIILLDIGSHDEAYRYILGGAFAAGVCRFEAGFVTSKFDLRSGRQSAPMGQGCC